MKKYRDHYFKLAKKENYPARSVYKLKEMDSRFHLLGPGMKVLDLGAAPGSWTIYAARKVGPSGLVLAVDLQPAGEKLPPNVRFFQEDVFERSPEFEAEFSALAPFDLVMSDMAPKTTGVKFTDQARSLDLAETALCLAQENLVRGGSFVVKIFMGPDSDQLRNSMRPLFENVKTFKPKSSRAESKEIFFVGLKFKGAGDQNNGPAV